MSLGRNLGQNIQRQNVTQVNMRGILKRRKCRFPYSNREEIVKKKKEFCPRMVSPPIGMENEEYSPHSDSASNSESHYSDVTPIHVPWWLIKILS